MERTSLGRCVRAKAPFSDLVLLLSLYLWMDGWVLGEWYSQPHRRLTQVGGLPRFPKFFHPLIRNPRGARLSICIERCLLLSDLLCSEYIPPSVALLFFLLLLPFLFHLGCIFSEAVGNELSSRFLMSLLGALGK